MSEPTNMLTPFFFIPPPLIVVTVKPLPAVPAGTAGANIMQGLAIQEDVTLVVEMEVDT